MKRLWSVGAVVVGLVASGFGIIRADTGFSGVNRLEDDLEDYNLVCHVLNTGAFPLARVTITLFTESGWLASYPETFTRVGLGNSVKSEVTIEKDYRRNIYCKVAVQGQTTWNGTLDFQKEGDRTVTSQLFHDGF